MKPILFNTVNVQAIMRGRKTQTRRAIKPQPEFGVISCPYSSTGHAGLNEFGACQCSGDEYNPRYHVGDILWVRETWCKVGTDVDRLHFENSDSMYDGQILYKADGVDLTDIGKWRPSIFMPRTAARLFLEVTNVSVEKLQDISEKDVFEEGCRIGRTIKWANLIPGLRTMNKEFVFIPLWDSINKKRGYGWETNPFCWVIEFKKTSVA